MPLDATVPRNDLNYLLFRQRIERDLARTAASAAARTAHADLANLYQQRIESLTGGNIRFPDGAPQSNRMVTGDELSSIAETQCS